MSREAAKLLLETALKYAAEQDATLTTVEPLCTQDEFAACRLMVGEAMGAVLLELINPIVGKYPDLKPPQMTSESKQLVGRITIRRYEPPRWRVTPSAFALRATADRSAPTHPTA
jgi:hypothetical protein